MTRGAWYVFLFSLPVSSLMNASPFLGPICVVFQCEDPHPWHAAATVLFRTGNSALGGTHCSGFTSRDTIRDADSANALRLVSSLQKSHSPCGGIFTPKTVARRCATSHRNSTGDWGSPDSNSPVAGQVLHTDRIRQLSHLLGCVRSCCRTFNRNWSQPSRTLPCRIS